MPCPKNKKFGLIFVSQPPNLASSMAIPKLSEIKKKAEEVFERTPCLWQLKVAETILERKQDIVCVAGTGSGKTLTFWLPLLFREGIQVVFTPLNILGTQNVSQLNGWGIKAISISAETATPQNLKDIEAGKYRVVVVNPEMALGKGCAFERVWRNKEFTSKLISVVWDEAHCISAWGTFREEYREAGWLRTILPREVPYLVPSATLSEKLCGDVMRILEMDRRRTKFIRRSNDRPNIFLDVRKIDHSISSFRDLMFLIPEDWKPSDGLPKFLIFFDNITESIAAADALRARLPKVYQEKLVWFNSNNTQRFREVSMDKFKNGQLFALCCTDSFGMGIDLADIEIIVQWKVTCNLDTLWQRFGRAARGVGRFGIVILMVEAKYFDEEKDKAEDRAKEREAKEAEKEKSRQMLKRKKASEASPNKRARTTSESGPSNAISASAGDVEGVAGLEARMGTEESSRVHGGSNSEVLTPSTGVASVSGPTGDGPREELSRFDLLRVEYRQIEYRMARVSRAKAKNAQASSDDAIEPALDALINAKFRGINCYRLPIMAFYENDLFESDHEKCAPTLRGGCTRCAIKKPPLCCSLCHSLPTHWEWLNNPVPALPPLPRMSTVPTKYSPSALDLDFCQLLDSWRCHKTREIFGLAFLKNTGGAFVLPDDVLARIADCARVGKINSLDTLFKETKWYHAREYHGEILQMIHENYPPPDNDDPNPDSTQPSRAAPSTSDTPAPASVPPSADGPTDSPRTKAIRTCGACGSTGHIRSSQKCPKYDKENRPPRRGPLSKASAKLQPVISDSTPSASTSSSRVLHDPASQTQPSPSPSIDEA